MRFTFPKRMGQILASLTAIPALGLSAEKLDIIGPPGSEWFGEKVTVLPNGNFIVVDSGYDLPGPILNVGAVYLYSGDGALISRLRGTNANDGVGLGGIKVLTNGHFVVCSGLWNGNRGAVTWGHAETGFGAAEASVSIFNSVVGSSSGEYLGETSNVCPLANGHYVLASPRWNGNRGAVRWCNGNGGTVGALSVANSLVGTNANDYVGTTLIALTSGHYVTSSQSWNGVRGAVTWGNGLSGTVGEVSALNSLVGTNPFDRIGHRLGGLPNGHYVTTSRYWASNAGAVTWCHGTGGTVGAVSAANSLVGSAPDDAVGLSVIFLPNSHFVVCSAQWNGYRGAATYCRGDTPTTGNVSSANSLVGSATMDQVGYGATALSNGHYVVYSPYWDGQRGAITWADGTAGMTGVVSTSNSWVGQNSGDTIGNRVTPLTNGNYVVLSPNWNGNRGAATWMDGSKAAIGTMSPAESLTGSDPSDFVGWSATALTQGNYVVTSPNWNSNCGAATWGNGKTGVKGVVSSANSLVGGSLNDSVGSIATVSLTNGHYVVRSPDFDNVTVMDAGAVTWGDGNKGTTGFVQSGNSLVGANPSDKVGSDSVTPLPNGHYIVASSGWDGDGITNAGAITWCNGWGGSIGQVTPANSIVGTANNDRLGQGITGSSSPVFADDMYVFSSAYWSGGVGNTRGMAGLADASSGISGFVSSANSVVGKLDLRGIDLSYAYDPRRRQLLVARPWESIVTILRMSRIHTLARTSTSAPGAADIAFRKIDSAAINSTGSVLLQATLSGSGSAAGRQRALFSGSAAGLDLVLQSGTPLVGLGMGMTSAHRASGWRFPVLNQPGVGLFLADVQGPGIGTANRQLLLRDTGINLFGLRRSGLPLAVTPLDTATIKSFDALLQSHLADCVVVPCQLNPGSGVNRTNDSLLLILEQTGAVKPNFFAREGETAFDGGGTFGALNPRLVTTTTVGLGEVLHFAAPLQPSSGRPQPALYRMRMDGSVRTRTAKAGDTAPGAGSATFGTFTGLSQTFDQAIVRATLTGVPASANEGIWSLPTAGLLLRKGEEFDPVNHPGLLVRRIIRFWALNYQNQLVTLVQLAGTSVNRNNDQALLLRQSDGVFRILARTGSSLHGLRLQETLQTIQAVDVHPVSGHYILLASIRGAPAGLNQALWTGRTLAGDNTTLAAMRQPQLLRRKGDYYRTQTSPGTLLRSIQLLTAPDPAGAGGRGLAQSISNAGHLVAVLAGDLRQTELVIMDAK